MKWHEQYKVNVPEGKSGDWEIKRFEVSEADARFFNIREMRTGRYIEPGTYTRLIRDNNTIMSDTPAEICDLVDFIRIAKGNILINGLGLGVVLQAILRNPSVERVHVTEKSQDVYDLVAPHYYNKFLNKIHDLHIFVADALTFTPRNIRYNFVWHDIWDDICGDNWETMTKLHRRYGQWCNNQDSWCRDRVMNSRG